MNALIVNITQRQYFIYDTDIGYTNILNDLLTPNKADADTDEGEEPLAFWDKKDHIVFVPRRLNNFVKQSYDRIFV